jgi:predicted PurR-regulated permease PerM
VNAERDTRSTDYLRRAIEVSIHVGLVILLNVACLLILRPFLPMIAWGMIIAIAAYPGYVRVAKLVGGRAWFAAAICTLLLLAVLIVPAALMTGTLVEGTQGLAVRIKEGTSIIPPPPPRVETWPVIGAPLAEAWNLASTNLTAAVSTFAPQIKAAIPGLLSASAGIGLAILESFLSILIAGALLANAAKGAEVAHRLAGRLFGDKGQEFERLAGSTIRSVTTGIIGVALIQTVFACVGFLVFGLPGAGLWAAVFLVAAVLQVGAVVLIPAVIYMFAVASTTKAAMFLIWCLIVGLMDNVLKPLLLGRGVSVPMAVVFLGAIGGFLSLGIIGLFVGPIVLAVGYKLFLAWLEGTAQITQEE